MEIKVVHETEEGLRAKLARLTEQHEAYVALEEQWGSIEFLEEEIDGVRWLLNGGDDGSEQ